MYLTRRFCEDPRLLVLTVTLILVAGASSFIALPRLEDPILTPRFASVTTACPGATAERVESLVTTKIESALQDLSEIKEIYAVNRSQVSFLAIELADSVSPELVPAIWSKIRDKIDDAYREMPANVLKPEFKQLEVKAHAQLLALVWDRAEPADYTILRRLAKRLQDRLATVDGTEKTTLFGDVQEEIVVEVDPQTVHAMGLTPALISQQIAAGDAKNPAGQVRGSSLDVMLEVTGEIDTLTRLSQIPISEGKDGRIVKLGDVGTVRRTIPSPPPAKAMISGLPAIVVGVMAKDDYRLDWWSQNIERLTQEFSQELPVGVRLQLVFDQQPYVAERFDSLWLNFVMGGIGVLGIVWLMMGWREAIVVGSSLPLACLVVFAALLVLEIPLHQMSITGLVIAMGLLIDNAIVVVDELSQKIRQGKTGIQAVQESIRFLMAPLIGSTVTTVASFAPIALMPGSSGEFVGSIAISTIIAVASSLLIAVTIIPGIAYIIMPLKSGALSSAARPDSWMVKIYRSSLSWGFRHPRTSILVSVIPCIVGFALFPQLREQFFPPADRDQFHIELELSSAAAMSDTEEIAAEIRKLALQHPEITDLHWFLGESAPAFYYNIIPEKQNVPYYGQALVQCRSQSAARQVMNRLQTELSAKYPQVHVVVRQLEQGPPFSAPLEVRLFGPSLDTLKNLGEQVRLVLTQTPQVTYTRCELAETTPKIVLAVDEDQLQLAGYDQTSIANLLFTTLEGSTGGSILEGTEEVPVRVRMLSDKRQDLNAIQSIFLPDPMSASLSQNTNVKQARLGMPLAAVTELRLTGTTSGSVALNRQQMNEVQAFIVNGELPAVVLRDFQQRLRDSGFSLPPGYRMTFGGASSERNEAVGNLMVYVAVLSFLLVATLILSLNSFRLAVVVGLVTIASVGYSLGALAWLQMPFGFMAIVGLMGMIGVVVNDSIVVLASIKSHAAHAKINIAALVDIVMVNTRHVVATSLTTLLGFLPLMLSGGEFWPPVAIVVCMGVAAATFLAILFVPCCYLLLYSKQTKTVS